MVRKSLGMLRKTRRKLRRWRDTPPVTPRRMLAHYSEGEKVVIDIHPSVQTGRPHPRFNGRVGVIVGKQGDAYAVRIRDGGKDKILHVLPIHLRRLK